MMDDKIYWMYGFWILLSGAKSVQAIRRLIAYHQLHVAPPTDRMLLAAFWTVAFLFYGHICIRKWQKKAAPIHSRQDVPLQDNLLPDNLTQVS